MIPSPKFSYRFELTHLITPSKEMMSSQNTTPLIESRSIDIVPRSERHGKVWHQGPFWFAGNFVLTTLVVGLTGPSMGLSLGFSGSS